MKKILVIGATGQIGSALMTKLRKEYGNDNVVAGMIFVIIYSLIFNDKGTTFFRFHTALNPQSPGQEV